MGKGKIKDICEDPRWPAFVRRYKYNWGLACEELFGLELTWQQEAIAADMELPGARVSVASGHGTGKSCLAGALMLIHCLTTENARVAVAAVKLETVKAGVWKYADAHWNKLQKSPHRWITKYFNFQQTKFYNRRVRGWAAVQKAGSKDKPEGLAGEHAPDLMYILDEASGLFEEGTKVITSALSEERNRLLMLSQPTRLSGYFFDSFHKLCKIRRGGLKSPDRIVNPDGIFSCHTLSSRESPLVSPKFIQEKILEFGLDSAAFKIKILGEFADESNLNLLTREEVHAAQRIRGKVKKGWSWVALCDIAEVRDASVCIIGKVSGDAHNNTQRFIPKRVLRYQGLLNSVAFAHLINLEVKETDYPGIVFNVDAQGIGAAAADILRDTHGRQVESIFWGGPCFSNEHKKHYKNKKAFGYISIRNGIKSGRIKVHTDVGEQIVVNEFTRIKALIDDAGRYVIESKKDMEGPSPDLADCYAMLPLARYSPPPLPITAEQQARRARVFAALDE